MRNLSTAHKALLLIINFFWKKRLNYKVCLWLPGLIQLVSHALEVQVNTWRNG